MRARLVGLVALRRSITNVIHTKTNVTQATTNILHDKTNFLQARPYCGRPPRCDAHMNELPIPCAPWNPWYKDRQNLYNKILVFGVLWFLFSLFMLIWTESLFLNWNPPKQPSPPSDMVEECDDSDI